MYHVIATRTVLPTLKSARAYNSAVQTPQILWSHADPKVVYDQALSIAAGYTVNEIAACVNNGAPIFQTSEWTYHLVADKLHKADTELLERLQDRKPAAPPATRYPFTYGKEHAGTGRVEILSKSGDYYFGWIKPLHNAHRRKDGATFQAVASDRTVLGNEFPNRDAAAQAVAKHGHDFVKREA